MHERSELSEARGQCGDRWDAVVVETGGSVEGRGPRGRGSV